MNNNELIEMLETRFNKNINFHKDILWKDVLARLNDDVLQSLKYMEETSGEPDVIMYDKLKDKYIYCDTSILWRIKIWNIKSEQ